MVLTLFRIDLFGEAHGCGGKKTPLPKICHTYPAMMKLGPVIPYIKKIQKYINHVANSLSSADINIFHWKSENFAISRNEDIDCILMNNFQLF